MKLGLTSFELETLYSFRMNFVTTNEKSFKLLAPTIQMWVFNSYVCGFASSNPHLAPHLQVLLEKLPEDIFKEDKFFEKIEAAFQDEEPKKAAIAAKRRKEFKHE